MRRFTDFNMNTPIKITGKDIIGMDGEDHTGALKELGVKFKSNKRDEVWNREFEVDLDFILRHGHLMNDEIYENHYKGSSEYRRYYNEGREAYLAGKEEDPPYGTGTIDDSDYWNTSLYHKCYPWYDGYRKTQAAAMKKKYDIKAMQKEIRAIIKRHGLTVKDCDEYPGSYSYAETPEGYFVKLT